jgi:hypothetical protein
MEWVFGIIGALLVIGCVIRVKERLAITERELFARTYLERFNRLAEVSKRRNFDGQTFEWLTMNVPKMQRALGHHGIMDYIAPFGRFQAHNYQLLVNTLPQIRTGNAQTMLVAACQEAILRYLGELKEEADDAGSLFNPVVWVREGVRFAVTFPLRLAAWSGLMSYSTFVRISHHPIVRILSAVAWTLGIAASIIQVAQAWDEVLVYLGLW